MYGGRPQDMRIKASKDLIQAATLIEYLAENDAQALHEAWVNLTRRGPGWLSRATEGLAALKRAFPHLNTAPLDLPE
jgi:hypothetical protein